MSYASTFTPASASRFRPECIPPATAFFEQQLGPLARPNRKGWMRVLRGCPFHESKSKKSFFVHLSGGYYCFGCGACGGDIISFLMRRDHLSFIDAARALGAWEDGAISQQRQKQLAKQQLKRQQLQSRAEEISRDLHALRIFLRAKIHSLEKIHRETSVRMRSLTGSAELETCWQILQDIHSKLQRAVAGYWLLSFGQTADCVQFLRRADQRAALIDSVIQRGFVADDSGRRMEIPL